MNIRQIIPFTPPNAVAGLTYTRKLSPQIMGYFGDSAHVHYVEMIDHGDESMSSKNKKWKVTGLALEGFKTKTFAEIETEALAVLAYPVIPAIIDGEPAAELLP